MHTIEERQSLKSSRKYDILMRFYLEERAQSRHHELVVALLAFQALLAAAAVVAAAVGKDVLVPGVSRLWLLLPAVAVCGGGLAAALVLQFSAIKNIDRSRWARKKIPWLDLDDRDKIGKAHRWIWRVFIAYFAALLLSSAAIVWKAAEIAEPREPAPWKAGE